MNSVYDRIIGISLQIIVSMIIGNSVLSFWEMINLLQLIRYMSLFTLYYPKSLLVWLSYIGIVNFDNPILSSLFELWIDKDKLSHHDTTDYRFSNLNLESKSILLSCSDMFMYLIILSFIILFIFMITLCIKPQSKVSKF